MRKGVLPGSAGKIRPIETIELAKNCAQIADEKKGFDISILDIISLFPLTDYFVIASGQTSKQLQTIADEINQFMKKSEMIRIGMEGYNEGNWILIDYGSVVIHLFLEEARQFYDLELLWGDAPAIEWAAVSVVANGESESQETETTPTEEEKEEKES